eukprot:scaffold18904_cov112-Isochrysis_galbana.AAC.10
MREAGEVELRRVLRIKRTAFGASQLSTEQLLSRKEEPNYQRGHRERAEHRAVSLLSSHE